MILHQAKRAVIVAPHEAPTLQTIIPSSRIYPFTARGQPLLAVRHGVDETRLLRNLGIKVPSPILSYYNWPHGSSISGPFAAQRETAAFCSLNPRCYILSTMGTGKSLSTLWAYDYLRSQGLAGKLLIIATLSSLDTAWGDSLRYHLPHLQYVVLHGERKKRRALLDFPADVYIINHHGVEILQEDLQAREDIDTVVIDEVADCARNSNTKMWRALDAVVNGANYFTATDGTRRRGKSKSLPKKWVWGLTGTPIPNQPTDAYAQARLITPETAPARFTWYRDQTMVQVSQFKWRAKTLALDGVDALDVVYKTLSPSIRFTLAECLDLPPTIHMDRYVPLTKDQQEAYDAMLRQYVVEAAEGTITAVNAGVKSSKLRQIACGCVRGFDATGEGIIADFDAEPRLAECLKLVQSSESGQSLVFVPFTAALHAVANYLRQHGRLVEVVYGDVSKTDRDRIFGAFQAGLGADTIVCHPKVMAHSLTLTAASLSIWFAPYEQAGIYEQANCRTPRPGQTRTTVIVNIAGTPLEQMMYKRLKNKQSTQNILLDMIQGSRE